MKFVVDENLPDILLAWLTERGHDVVHVRDWLRGGAMDGEIWSLAEAQQRVVVTKDHDFHLRRSLTLGPQVLLLRVGNRSNAALLQDVEAAWPQVGPELAEGRSVCTIHRHDFPVREAD